MPQNISLPLRNITIHIVKVTSLNLSKTIMFHILLQIKFLCGSMTVIIREDF